jgi:hypothetical protein
MTVRVAISNIAWDPAEDDAVADVLRRHRVDAVDIAPGKYFPDPPAATDAEIERVRRAWAERGVRIHGMQALLFGTVGLNLFGEPDVRRAMRSAGSALAWDADRWCSARRRTETVPGWTTRGSTRLRSSSSGTSVTGRRAAASRSVWSRTRCDMGVTS